MPRKTPVTLRPTGFSKALMGLCGSAFILVGLMCIGQIDGSGLGVLSAFLVLLEGTLGSYMILHVVLASVRVEPKSVVVRSQNTLKKTVLNRADISHVEVRAYPDITWMDGVGNAAYSGGLLCPVLVLQGEAKPIYVKLLSSYNITRRWGGRPARRKAEMLAHATGVPFLDGIGFESNAPQL